MLTMMDNRGKYRIKCRTASHKGNLILFLLYFLSILIRGSMCLQTSAIGKSLHYLHHHLINHNVPSTTNLNQKIYNEFRPHLSAIQHNKQHSNVNNNIMVDFINIQHKGSNIDLGNTKDEIRKTINRSNNKNKNQNSSSNNRIYVHKNYKNSTFIFETATTTKAQRDREIFKQTENLNKIIQINDVAYESLHPQTIDADATDAHDNYSIENVGNFVNHFFKNNQNSSPNSLNDFLSGQESVEDGDDRNDGGGSGGDSGHYYKTITERVSGSDHDDDDADDRRNALNIRPNSFNNNEDKENLMRLVMEGLGLKKLPDMKKVNISQHEYLTKYNEYIRLLHEKRRRYEITTDAWNKHLHLLSVTINNSTMNTETVPHKRQKRFSDSRRNISRDLRHVHGKTVEHQQSEKVIITLYFPFDATAAMTRFQDGDLEDANIRLMIIHSAALAVKRRTGKNQQQNNRRRPCLGSDGIDKARLEHSVPKPRHHRHVLNFKVYQILEDAKNLMLDSKKVEIEIDRKALDTTYSQWLQFDVTKAVQNWLNGHKNMGIQVHCDNCQRLGARILNDIYASSNLNNLVPVLNIVARVNNEPQESTSSGHSFHSQESYHNTQATYSTANLKSAKHQRTDCHGQDQRCCRHKMEVVFKEIKGFEFIIQPKVFDAGYCRGRCPPRYNPAHHHAMLQSLIWKQDRSKAPRPCCAPSKLVELEVLHVDEKDSEKLKISTWTDMRVIECACS